MTVAAAFFSVSCFLLAFQRLGITRVASRALKTGSQGFAFLSDGALSDDEKELAVRQASLSLFKDVFSIGVRTLGAVLASLVPLIFFQMTGLASMNGVAALLSTWPAIVTISIVMTIWFLLRRRL